MAAVMGLVGRIVEEGCTRVRPAGRVHDEGYRHGSERGRDGTTTIEKERGGDPNARGEERRWKGGR